MGTETCDALRWLSRPLLVRTAGQLIFAFQPELLVAAVRYRSVISDVAVIRRSVLDFFRMRTFGI